LSVPFDSSGIIDYFREETKIDVLSAIFAGLGVLAGNLYIFHLDFVEFFGRKQRNPAVEWFETGAGEGLDLEDEFGRGKIEVAGDIPEAHGIVGAPCQNSRLIF
jgi:hypothetical protein